jgi:hypothetical protein
LSADGIAAVDLTTGTLTPWIANASRRVLALAVSGNTVYAGGGFSSIGGQPRNGIAALDAETGAVLPWNPDPGSGTTGGVVWSLAAYGNTVYAGGLFERMGVVPSAGLAAITAANGSAPTVGVPEATGAHALTLAQSAPNPARSSALIRFTLPAAGPVSLTVYDLQGRRVATLLDRVPQPVGTHEVPVHTDGWRTGCYLYRLEAGGMTATRKMMVVQ